MIMAQATIHYGIHFLLPLLIALLFFKSNWKTAYVIMLCGLLIDLDHFLADPFFDSERCSLLFHPLHSYYAIVVYLGSVVFKKTRVFGIGLLVHIFADGIDCLMM